MTWTDSTAPSLACFALLELIFFIRLERTWYVKFVIICALNGNTIVLPPLLPSSVGNWNKKICYQAIYNHKGQITPVKDYYSWLLCQMQYLWWNKRYVQPRSQGPLLCYLIKEPWHHTRRIHSSLWKIGAKISDVSCPLSNQVEVI